MLPKAIFELDSYVNATVHSIIKANSMAAVFDLLFFVAKLFIASWLLRPLLAIYEAT